MSLFTAKDRQLWRLALPMILFNITVPLLGLVDTAVIATLTVPSI
nr:MATE family efflux transporter [Candidatus Pantoea persica]